MKYVATLDPGTTINRIQISPDGGHAAFLTAARLTSYDNQGWREMYTYNPDNRGRSDASPASPPGSRRPSCARPRKTAPFNSK